MDRRAFAGLAASAVAGFFGANRLTRWYRQGSGLIFPEGWDHFSIESHWGNADWNTASWSSDVSKIHVARVVYITPHDGPYQFPA